MRRWLLLALCLLLPACALAQPQHAPYDMALSLRYRALTEAQQAIFDLIYDAAWEGRETVDLPGGADYDELDALHQLLVWEAPELCTLSNVWNVWYYEREPQRVTAVTLHYDLPPEARQALLTCAEALAEQVPADEGDWQRTVMLHDLVCGRVTYANADNENNAYGALVEGTAVCGGYTQAYSLLLRLTGVPCAVVVGQARNESGEWTPHAWSMVELAGQTVLTDVTWDDQPEGGPVHWYFALPERWMAADHLPDAGGTLPACTTLAWSWEVMRGGYVPSGRARAALEEALRNLALSGRTQDLRFESDEDFRAINEDFYRLWGEYNDRAAPEERVYGTLTRHFSEAQRCLTIAPAP